MEDTVLRENTRAYSYKLLSECYYAPSEKLIRMLNSLEEFPEGDVASGLFKNVPNIDALESLNVEYSRLFLGPFKVLVPPYGSVYLENGRQTMGESTMDARNWYREEKLTMLLKDVPDHIAVELEFMYFLIFKQIEAINDDKPKVADDYLRKEADFLKSHLGAWVGEFADKVIEESSVYFYKELARLTKEFVLSEGGASNE